MYSVSFDYQIKQLSHSWRINDKVHSNSKISDPMNMWITKYPSFLLTSTFSSSTNQQERKWNLHKHKNIHLVQKYLHTNAKKWCRSAKIFCPKCKKKISNSIES